MKRCTAPLLCVLMFASLPTLASPAEKDHAARIADSVLPYVSRDAIVVAHVDLRQVDTDATLDLLAEVVGQVQGDREAANRQARQAAVAVSGFRDQLQEAGVTELFAVASLEGVLERDFELIVPVAAGGDHGRVARLLFSGRADGPSSSKELAPNELSGLPFDVCRRVGDVVYCGSEATAKRLPLPQQDRADQQLLTAGFRAADGTVRVVIIPTEPLRVLREMNPALPQEIGGLSGRELADGLRWLAFSVDSPPRLAMRVTIQSADEDSCKKLRATIGNALAWIAGQPVAQKAIPNLAEFSQQLLPRREGDRLELSVDGETLQLTAQQTLASFGRLVDFPDESAQTVGRMKRLALAMWNFESAYGSLPPASSYSDNGNKLLSWRVFLLPFLEQQELYEQFKLDEPWNSPHNRRLISKMPEVFLSKRSENAREGKTSFLLPSAEGTPFHGRKGARVQDITDGTSKTVMIVEAAPEHAVIWTRPGDWQVDLEHPMKGLTSEDDQQVNFAFCDGSVQTFDLPIDTDRLRRFLLMDDREPVDR